MATKCFSVQLIHPSKGVLYSDVVLAEDYFKAAMDVERYYNTTVLFRPMELTIKVSPFIKTK